MPLWDAKAQRLCVAWSSLWWLQVALDRQGAQASCCADMCPAGIIKEVAMMRMLAGHPCAVQLHGVYESDTHFYLVRLVSCLSLFQGVRMSAGQAADAGSVQQPCAPAAQHRWQCNWLRSLLIPTCLLQACGHSPGWRVQSGRTHSQHR